MTITDPNTGHDTATDQTDVELDDQHFEPLRNELAGILGMDPDELKPRD